MKVKNISALRNLVERSGMTVADDGRVASNPAVAPSAPSTAEIVASVLKALPPPKVITVERSAPAFVAPQPTKWVFTVERDEDGFMSKITAEAK